MSRFLNKKYKKLEPYTPGEQPKYNQYTKLNTNESPFPPSPKAVEECKKVLDRLQLYPDPECTELVKLAMQKYEIKKDEVIFTNGSDEILNFAFMALCDKKNGVAFPNITYGFYKVFAELHGIPYEEIPLDENFAIEVDKYCNIGKNIFIPNPNAPTGLAVGIAEIEKIIRSNPNNLVVVDEAYVDFGTESCVPLIHKYDNLLVTQTFSKGYSMAGARLGLGIGNKNLIQDINTIKYATNPYNINSMSMAMGIGTLKNEEYIKNNCKRIIENRRFVIEKLQELEFDVTDSQANFVFAKHNKVGGEYLYAKLKEKGILVRHFDKKIIEDYNRITIGTIEQMQELIQAIDEILEGEI